MKGKSVTLTVIANMTSNYGEGLGNISSVQKVFKNGKIYSARSKESLKNAIMVQSGLYNDLETSLDKKVNQKVVSKDLNATNCRALEGGYMNTSDNTYVRKSSFYLTDAVSCDEFINEYRFHNNLYLATNYAKHNNINLQGNAQKAGLMPYQYEFDKSLKIYSLTIDLDMIGRDENFDSEEASAEEKAYRVNAILDAVKNLSLIVKGNLDNAEPVFVVGGLSDRKTHYFENVVKVEEDRLVVSKDLIEKVAKGYNVGLLRGQTFINEGEIEEKLNPMSVMSFFDKLREDVNAYFEI